MTGSVGVLHYRCVLPTHVSWQCMFYTSYRRLAYARQCGNMISIEWPCGSFQSLGLQLRSTLGFALCKLLNDKKQVSAIILSPTVSHCYIYPTSPILVSHLQNNFKTISLGRVSLLQILTKIY